MPMKFRLLVLLAFQVLYVVCMQAAAFVTGNQFDPPFRPTNPVTHEFPGRWQTCDHLYYRVPALLLADFFDDEGAGLPSAAAVSRHNGTSSESAVATSPSSVTARS